MLITLRNDFHNSHATVRPDADGIVSVRATREAERKLCGIKECRCGRIRGRQDAVIEYGYDQECRKFLRILDAAKEVK